MNLDEVEQLGVLMCRPRSTSVLHDDSGGRCVVCWVKMCRRWGEKCVEEWWGRWGLYPFSIGFSGVIQGKATYNGESEVYVTLIGG